MPFNGQRAYEYAKSISFPRLSAGPGEREAGDYIIRVLEGFGLKPEIHAFSYSSFPSTVVLRAALLFQILLLLSMIVLSKSSPLIATALAVLLVAITLKSTRWGSLFEKGYSIGRQKSSRNIFKRIVGNAPHTNLIFLAHYDSKSQTVPLFLRVLCYSFFYTGLLVLALLVVSSLVLGQEVLTADGFLYAGLGVSVVSIPLLLNVTRDSSPGALDNASGVGIVLELARNLSNSVPDGLDLTFVFTGAEEDGLAGAIRFAQDLGISYDGRETYCLSYDGAGADGKIRITSRYGIPPVRTSKTLVGAIRDFLTHEGVECVETCLPVGAGLEQTPLSFHGLEVVTVHSGKLGRAVLAIHSPGDRLENLDVGAMETCGMIGVAIVDYFSKKKIFDHVRNDQ